MRSIAIGAPLRVAVLAGGESAEREISLHSGAAVAAALDEAGHQAIAIDPAGRKLSDIDWSAFDACFIALHGGAGEDGVQRELDALGVPYTGSSAEACRLAMSKSASKERFAECRVPTPPWTLLDLGQPHLDPWRDAAAIGYPLVVKPDSQGSSLGVALADSPDTLTRAISAAGRYDRLLIAERRVIGREFTIAVWGQRALPIIEIVTPEQVFSYDAKYSSSLTVYRFDFELPTRARVELLHWAVAATQALGTSGLARVDAMFGNDGKVWVLEVNTIPGMTPRSLAPLAAQRAGWPMAELCSELVRQSISSTVVA